MYTTITQNSNTENNIKIVAEPLYDGMTALDISGKTLEINSFYNQLTAGLLIAAFINIAVLAYFQIKQRRDEEIKAKQRLVFDLHREFSDMIDLRIRLDHGLRKISGRIPEQHPLESDFWKLVAFYDRLFLAIEAGIADKRLAIKFMGYLLCWWFRVHLKEKFGERDFDAVNQVKQLYDLVVKYTDNTTHQNWLNRIDADRDEIRSHQQINIRDTENNSA